MADTEQFKADPDPAPRGLIIGFLVSLIVAVAARYGLPLDNETATLVAGAIVTLVGPLVTTLIIRARAWKPASVVELRRQMQQMIDEAQSENPPPVVTAQGVTTVAGGEHASPSTGTEDGLPGRHHQED